MSTHCCPNDETLASYFDGLLSPDLEAALFEEMMECSDCVSLLASLGVVIHESNKGMQVAEVPLAVTRRAMDLMSGPVHEEEKESVVQLAVRWLEGMIAPLAHSLQPLNANSVAVRGAAAERYDCGEELRFHVTLGAFALEVDLEVDGPQEVSLTVRPMSPPPSGLLLRLTSDGRTRAVSSLGAVGATVVALPTGNYDLILEQGSQSLGMINLALHT